MDGWMVGRVFTFVSCRRKFFCRAVGAVGWINSISFMAAM
jgi:hypothetical protein